MGTKLYLTSESPNTPYPSMSTANFFPKVYHNWPTSSSPYLLKTISNTSSEYRGGNFTVDPQTHYSQIGTFMSPSLMTNQSFSQEIKFVATMGESHLRVQVIPHIGVDGLPDWYEYITYSSYIEPAVKLYVWRPSTNAVVGTLSNTTFSTFFDTTAPKLYTYSLNPSTISALMGDRIVCELYYYQTPYLENSQGWGGLADEHFYFNNPLSYISFSETMQFGEVIFNTSKYKYNIGKRISQTQKYIYNFGFRNIFTNLSSLYYMYSYRYIALYMETESTARGKASLIIKPRSSTGLTWGLEDYSQKWVLPQPTLHRFKMIDDFEGYHDINDAALYWTVSDGLVTFSAKKTFSYQDFSDYEILTFYAMSSRPSFIRMRFGDNAGNSSSNHSFFITEKWQRYETLVNWGGCDSRSVNTFEILGDYDGKVIVDDIMMLDYDSGMENIDWIKMNLTDMDFGRESKLTTFKIPFKDSETLQFSGEKNGEGQFNIRSMDSMQNEFLHDCMKRNVPLYFRYKNYGFPVVLRDTDRDIRQIIPKEVSSDITIPFYEIYDFSNY